jgi:hypothetical protein
MGAVHRNISELYVVGEAGRKVPRLRRLKVSQVAVEALSEALRIGRPAVKYGVPTRRHRGPR